MTEAAALSVCPTLCPIHLLLHLAQEWPQRRVAPDELFDGAHDARTVQRGLVVAEAGDARQLVVAHLVTVRDRVRVGSQWEGEVVRVSVRVRVGAS